MPAIDQGVISCVLLIPTAILGRIKSLNYMYFETQEDISAFQLSLRHILIGKNNIKNCNVLHLPFSLKYKMLARLKNFQIFRKQVQ